MSAPLRVRVWCGPCGDWIALGESCPHYDTAGLPLPPLTLLPRQRDACPECEVGRVIPTGPADPTGWQPAKCSRDCGWVQ